MVNSAPTAAPPLHKCQTCQRQFLECWRFRDDDQFCSLCGERILHLEVHETAPDRVIWLYLPPAGPLTLTISWRRQAAGGPARVVSGPPLDWHHCRAHFNDDHLGDVLFEVRKPPEQNGRPEEVVLELTPMKWALKDLNAPDAGANGEIRFVWANGGVRRKAKLLPAPAGRYSCKCVDRGNRAVNGVFQVYQRGASVTVPMRLTAEVPVWVLTPAVDVQARSDVRIECAAEPQLLEAGRPFPFTLRLNTTEWTPQEAVSFQGSFPLLNQPPITFQGAVALVEGEELSFGDRNVWEQELQLGRVASPYFLLSASEGAASAPGGAPGIQLEQCRVLLEPDVGGWLRVLHPQKDNLPLTVPPRGQGSPVRLDLEVDTTRLDRKDFDGKLLKGVAELRDSRSRLWTCEVRLTLSRPKRLRQYLAIDWGTTNSCAAYRGRDQAMPCAVKFHRDQQSLELFPSDVYFEDIRDHNSPIFLIGEEARYRAQLRPECCLRSVKRKFQFLDEVFVMDEFGRTRRYPVQEIVKFLLLRLVTLAEDTQGQEIILLGLTFPTKWPPRVRRKLAAVTLEVEKELKPYRRGEDVKVWPPEIDEANAVAINLLMAEHTEDLPRRFHLIAYDFGGGTVDTSILEVQFLPEKRELRTDYVGIGGRSDFGGDDVTRAVMMLLHQRLLDALKGSGLPLDEERTRTARVRAIPLVADGDELPDPDEHRTGRKNWDGLWRAAEGIKIDLCRQEKAPAVTVPGPGTANAPPVALLEFDANPIKKHLDDYLSVIHCRIAPSDGPEEVLDLDHLLRWLSGEDRDRFYRDLRFTLDQACEYPLVDIDGANGGRQFTVQERVEDTIDELRRTCDDRGVEPHIIVLAGGGCRLPLIADLMKDRFPGPAGQGPRLNYDAGFAKQRVAHGMAHYLFMRQWTKLSGLAKSVEVLHRGLGLMSLDWARGGKQRFDPIVRVGARVNDPKVWHSFTFPPPDEDGRLPVFFQDWRQGEQLFGHVDFTRPCEPLAGDEPCHAAPLPRGEGDDCQGELRLRGVDHMEVRVLMGKERYGPYPLVPAVSDPEEILQT